MRALPRRCTECGLWGGLRCRRPRCCRHGGGRVARAARDGAGDEPDLVLANGIYLFRGEPLDGVIEEQYPGGAVKGRASYSHGMRHGTAQTFYADSRLRDTRSYRASLSYGRHVGYWDNGNLKFDFTYLDEKREGLQRQWYRSGAPYTALTFRDDKEDGLQRALAREREALHQLRGARRLPVGLQKSALCYKLADEAIKGRPTE